MGAVPSLLNMKLDKMFPDDANGDVLRRMQKSGDDLTKPREINFTVIFPTDEAALAFAIDWLRKGLKVSFAPDNCDDNLPWQIQVHPILVPTHEIISAFEAELEAQAVRYGGRNDGWGCFECK